LVRSAAVHGELLPNVTDKTLTNFVRSVHQTLTDYLQVTSRHGITRRSKLLTYLDSHPDRDKVVDWVLEHGGPEWADYFSRLRDQVPPGRSRCRDRGLVGEVSDSPSPQPVHLLGSVVAQ
jgi:hypothetical protein